MVDVSYDDNFQFAFHWLYESFLLLAIQNEVMRHH